MKVVRGDLWLCTECLQPAVNDEWSSFDYYYTDEEERDAKILRVRRGLEALGPHLVPDFDSETGEGHKEFARAPIGGCACCRTNLAGEWHRFAVLGD